VCVCVCVCVCEAGFACCGCRYRLGLVQPPAAALPEDGTPEWIELRPRWPLTSSKHHKSMPPVLSMKKPEKQATSLTDLTQQELSNRGGSSTARQPQPAGAQAAGVAGAACD
jgi:hypothetical protein